MMIPAGHHSRISSRRRFLRIGAQAAASAVAIAALPALRPATRSIAARPARAFAAPHANQPVPPDFRRLDGVIREAMVRYSIPGVAVGLILGDQQYTNGYGITNVNAPFPVDQTTLFQTGSITKTYTATAVMRLIEQGTIDLEAPIRRYLPDFRVADEFASAHVTVRQALTHLGDWYGDYLGPPPQPPLSTVWPARGDAALADYVRSMGFLPQLAPLGYAFSYNNTGFMLAGRIMEVLLNQTYEVALTEQVLVPLGMTSSFFFPEEAIIYPTAAGHTLSEGNTGTLAVSPDWAIPRSLNAAGGLILNMDDQLRYARFHLGDGTAADGTRLLSAASLADMHAPHGPGGSVETEVIVAMGLGWWREEVGGALVLAHGGSTFGQQSQIALVPERDFAFAMFTNADLGVLMVVDLMRWALREYLELADPPPMLRDLSPERLAEYAGSYGIEVDAPDADTLTVFDVTVQDGGLQLLGEVGQASPTQRPVPAPSGMPANVKYGGGDTFIVPEGIAAGTRFDFIREPSGRVQWVRSGGRLFPRLAEA